MDIKVQIIGLGYIGLPTAICISERIDRVHGYDISEEKIIDIQSSKIDKNEPFLEEKLKKALSKSLTISSNLENADVYIICVPTPFLNDKTPDLSFVFDVVEKIASILKKGDMVILESTVPIGTTEKIRDIVKKRRDDLHFSEHNESSDSDIHIAYCPERVLPGNIFEELYKNSRVIGGLTKKCSEKASEIYELFVSSTISKTDSKTAEFIKLAENTYRDINIAIANEFSMMAHKEKLDINEIISITNQHPRVNILKPGVGVGGHCLAVDPYFLINSFPNESSLTFEARKINLKKEDFSYNLIKEFIKKNNLKNISLFGASYKPNSNDLRESPSFRILKRLANDDLFIYLCEPNILRLDINKENIMLCSAQDCLSNGDGYIFMVPHDVFKSDDFFNITKPYIDFCNLI